MEYYIEVVLTNRSEHLKLIIEFDGLPHYTNPDIIEKDSKNTVLIPVEP